METNTPLGTSNDTADHQAKSLAENQAEGSTPSESPTAASSPRQIIGRFVSPTVGNGARTSQGVPALPPPAPRKAALAVFCLEAPDGYVGGHVRQIAKLLAERGHDVHLFTSRPFGLESPRVKSHVLEGQEGDLVTQAEEFAGPAVTAFQRQFVPGTDVTVIGYEWASIPTLSLLQKERNIQSALSLHTVERQRTTLTSEISRQIENWERIGLQQARALLIHDTATAEVARQMVPECLQRITQARSLFPASQFDLDLDPGQVKARYQIGPVDPTILFVGDLKEQYGPDVAVKAMPAVLRHHKQARLVVVGDGAMYWPLRVYTRYLLLEHAIRLPGHVQNDALHELIRASDIVVVPSRESTPWWPILAAWAAGRPVLATHSAAPGFLEHEKDAVLFYPSENSCVWGIERILYDPALRETLAVNGRKKLEERFGWGGLAKQVEELTGLVAAETPR